MRGWTARRQEIESQQTDPRNHDGLIFDSALAAHNDRELESAEMDMVNAYVAANDIAALDEGDEEYIATRAAVAADAERCERSA